MVDRAEVLSIIVPLYKKIRITLEDILIEVRKFDLFIKEKMPDTIDGIWDVYLNTSNNYKEEVISNEAYSDDFKEKVIFNQFPKYIWIARLLLDDFIIFELIFDSTDVSGGQCCLMLNCIDGGLLAVLKSELKNQDFRDFVTEDLNPRYLKMFDLLGDDSPAATHKLEVERSDDKFLYKS
jgi:hypothetical protein